MYCLAIETSCDDTCASVVSEKGEVLSNVISSQNETHAKFGGVFPELAAREHVQNCVPVIHEALNKANVPLEKIDLFAATMGPGLINSLLTGLGSAKALAYSQKKPFLGINHIEAHLYPALLESKIFPSLGVILSGGHTILVLIEDFGKYRHISSTIDDAIGEAFDKVACLLGYPYPGGAKIEALAKKGDPQAYPFKGGKVKSNPLAFSFSGLKTAVLYQKQKTDLKQSAPDLAASFQRAAFEDVCEKISLSLKNHPIKSLVFGGGVVQNQTFQKMCSRKFPKTPLHFPPSKLSSDNAAMIGLLAFSKWKKKKASPFDLTASSRLPFFLCE